MSLNAFSQQIKFENIPNEYQNKILQIIDSTFKIFNIHNLKANLTIRLTQGDPEFATYNKGIINIYKNEEFREDIFAHEFTHFILEELIDEKLFIRKDFFLEMIPDFIAFDYRKEYQKCELKYERLNYSFSYKNEHFFNESYFIQEAFKCCQLVKSKFCENLEYRSTYYSSAYLVRIGKFKNYPLSKDYTQKHYIALPLLFYFNELIMKNIMSKKEIIKKLMNIKNKENFIQENFYDKELFDKYYLEKVKELI